MERRRTGARPRPRSAGPCFPNERSLRAPRRLGRRPFGELRRASADLVPWSLVGDLDVERVLEVHVLQAARADVDLLAAVGVHARTALAAKVAVGESFLAVSL